MGTLVFFSFREKVWNSFLLCMEGLAHGKDIRSCRAGDAGNFADKGKTNSSGGTWELDKLDLEIRCSFLAVIKHLNGLPEEVVGSL